MTLFKGVLLFDIAEPEIGNWENELGWRGMREVWHLKGQEHIEINIDPNDDADNEEWEVWQSNNKSGEWGSIGYGNTFEEADKIAKEYMREHPQG